MFKKLVRLNWQKIIFVSVVLTVVSRGPVLAEDNPLAQPLTLSETKRISADELKSHAQALQDLYTQQIESYKLAEKDYQLAKTQQTQLGTLSSVEATTQFARTAMIERADVLITYFNLLHDYLVMADGMEPGDKEKTSADIIEHIQAYQTHRLAVSNIEDRASLNLAADEFDQLFKVSTSLVYRVLYNLDLSQMNSYRLTAVDLYQQLQRKQADLPLSPAKLAQRDRAYLDIERVFAQLSTQIEFQQQLVADENKGGQGIYEQGATLLVETRTDLIRVLGYLQELASVI